MKLIVMSDIHGNIQALEAALNIMERFTADRYLFLGDMVGYYANQNECVSLLKDIPNLISLKGNHDHMFLRFKDDDKAIEAFDSRFCGSYSAFRDSAQDDSIEFLLNAQLYYQNDIFEAYHGSPNDDFLFEYIYPDTPLENIRPHAPYMFLGHTHHAMDRRHGNTRIINPGSIGQPRDGRKGSFAIVDTDADEAEIIKFEIPSKVSAGTSL